MNSKFHIETIEETYYTYEVEAETESEAMEKVLSGQFDPIKSDSYYKGIMRIEKKDEHDI